MPKEARLIQKVIKKIWHKRKNGVLRLVIKILKKYQANRAFEKNNSGWYWQNFSDSNGYSDKIRPCNVEIDTRLWIIIYWDHWRWKRPFVSNEAIHARLFKSPFSIFWNCSVLTNASESFEGISEENWKFANEIIKQIQGGRQPRYRLFQLNIKRWLLHLFWIHPNRKPRFSNHEQTVRKHHNAQQLPHQHSICIIPGFCDDAHFTIGGCSRLPTLPSWKLYLKI